MVFPGNVPVTGVVNRGSSGLIEGMMAAGADGASVDETLLMMMAVESSK